MVNSNSKERVPFIQGKGGEGVAGDDLKVSATDAFLDEECAFAEGEEVTRSLELAFGRRSRREAGQFGSWKTRRGRITKAH